MVAEQSVDDMLNEIKEGVEAASEGEAAEQPLELTDAEVSEDDKVDIAEFEASGEIKAADENTEGGADAAPADTSADDEAAVDDIDLDALMAEVGAEDDGEAPAEAESADADVDALLDEAEGITPEVEPAAAAPAAQSAAEQEPVYLNAIPSAKGLQVGFPMEILAEALRPLVSEWVMNNLPAITERLVKEEIARLTADTSEK